MAKAKTTKRSKKVTKGAKKVVRKAGKKTTKKTFRGILGLRKEVAKIIREYRRDEHFDSKIGPDEIVIYMGHQQNLILKRIDKRLQGIETQLNRKRK